MVLSPSALDTEVEQPPHATRATARRVTFAALGLLALLVLAALLSLSVGAKAIPVGTVIDALFSHRSTPDHAVIWDGRVPRTVLGVVAGLALGVAGALIQGITRNPLADPGVLGVNAGAAFAVVLAVGFLGIDSALGYIWFAFLGALLATVAVYLVGTGGRRDIDPIRLTLAGVALGAVLTGIGSGLALLRPEAFDQLRTWTIGTLDVRSLTPSWTILPFVAVGLGIALLSGRGLNAVALGDDLARSLGVSATRTRIGCLLAITLLAGSATAAAGSIGFIGLMVPHAARRICGPDQRWIITLSALIAPIVLLCADVLGRVIIDGEMQVGIVTAFVGAPVLIALARRRRLGHL